MGVFLLDGTVVAALSLPLRFNREEHHGEESKETDMDRARVADYEVRYESKKTGRSRAAVKKAVKKVGNSSKRVENRLGR